MTVQAPAGWNPKALWRRMVRVAVILPMPSPLLANSQSLLTTQSFTERLIMLKYLVIVSLLSACVPSPEVIVGPNGERQVVIECIDPSKCLSLAGEECPRGYAIAHPMYRAGIVVLGGLAPRQKLALVVTCR